MHSVKKITSTLLAFTPILGYAQGIAPVNALVGRIIDVILNPFIYLMFAIATLVFIWGAKNFVGAADDAEARGKGAQQMIWGMVGMLIMISARVMVDIISNTAQTL